MNFRHRLFKAEYAGLLAMATSPGSSLIAMPGRQAGHVQLISLPPCPPHTATLNHPQIRSPIILAHTHPLSTLACTASGSHILTTSERGTLLRVWDASRGRLERELRRGMDRAEMWGVQFQDGVREADKSQKGGMVVGWSDKGTVHVWDADKTGEPSKRYVSRSSVVTVGGSCGSALRVIRPHSRISYPEICLYRNTFHLHRHLRSTAYHGRTLMPFSRLSERPPVKRGSPHCGSTQTTRTRN